MTSDAPTTGAIDVQELARTRLRSLRTTLGYSLDELAARTHLSPSTISRLETGKRSLGLDVVIPLAQALHVSLDVLFEAPSDDDVVIRPVPHSSGTRTTWPLSRPDGRTVAQKVRLPLHVSPRREARRGDHDLRPRGAARPRALLTPAAWDRPPPPLPNRRPDRVRPTLVEHGISHMTREGWDDA